MSGAAIHTAIPRQASSGDILGLIRDRYPQLSHTQKRIADYILQQPEDACFASLKELTGAVGVTEVTMVNFARRLGIDGFSGLKRELQAYIRQRLSPNEKITRAIEDVRSSGKSEVYSAFQNNELAALSGTYGALSEEQVHQAVNLLKDAQHIFLLGYDVSLPVVQFLRLRLHYLGYHATQLNLADRSQLLLALTQAEPEDLFVMISFPNHAPEMARTALYLHQRQIPLLAITDQLTAPIAVYATQTIACSTGDLLFYNTITAPISLVNLLCAFLAMGTPAHLHETRLAVEQAYASIFDTEPVVSPSSGPPKTAKHS